MKVGTIGQFFPFDRIRLSERLTPPFGVLGMLLDDANFLQPAPFNSLASRSTPMCRLSLLPRRIRLLAVCFGLILASVVNSSSSQAAITFSFDYSSNEAGVGFLDTNQGAARQLALTTAGNLFSNLFGSHFSNMANLTFSVTSTDDINTPTLASAGSNFIQAQGTFGDGEVIRNKLISGNDINRNFRDGYVDVNWGYQWELDPNTPAVGPGAGQSFDFYAALFHEFTHAIGFGSEISATNNSDRFGDGGPGSGKPGSWAKWDQFLTDTNGTSLIDPNTGEINQAAFNDAQAQGGLFTGAKSVLALGSGAKLFANPDQSHLDEVTFSTPNTAVNFMMKPARDYGPQEARLWSSLEVGILTDLGFSPVSAVPEPGSYAVVLVGIFAYEVRRRRGRIAA